MTEKASKQPKVVVGLVSPKELGTTRYFPLQTLYPAVMLDLSGIFSETDY